MRRLQSELARLQHHLLEHGDESSEEGARAAKMQRLEAKAHVQAPDAVTAATRVSKHDTKPNARRKRNR